jgi:hypothetical protein
VGAAVSPAVKQFHAHASGDVSLRGPSRLSERPLLPTAGWAEAKNQGIMTSMNAIRVGTTIDEAVARAIPALRPLLGKRVELIALDESPGGAANGKLSVDELLASRVKLPPGVGPLSAEDIEHAIAEGAQGR